MRDKVTGFVCCFGGLREFVLMIVTSYHFKEFFIYLSYEFFHTVFNLYLSVTWLIQRVFEEILDRSQL